MERPAQEEAPGGEGMTDGRIVARVQRDRVTADGDWCLVDLGEREEFFRLLLASVTHPGEAVYMEVDL